MISNEHEYKKAKPNIIQIPFKVKQWKDKGTGSWIIYYKKADLCAYGETKKKAMKRFLQEIENIFWDSMSEMQKRHAYPTYNKRALALEKSLKLKKNKQ